MWVEPQLEEAEETWPQRLQVEGEGRLLRHLLERPAATYSLNSCKRYGLAKREWMKVIAGKDEGDCGKG